MDIATIVTILGKVVEYAPQAFDTGKRLYDLGVDMFAIAQGREPTAAEQDELRAETDRMHAAIQALPDHD